MQIHTGRGDVMTKIRVIIGDITKQTDVESIVNAANKSLLGGGGVDGAIHYAAGEQLLEECRKLNGCNTSEAKITNAYHLPCKYVIHTVGPIWHGGKDNERELLKRCYTNSLKLAMEKNIRTIAFPSISTGAYGYPIEYAAFDAIAAVVEFVGLNPHFFELIEWVCIEPKTFTEYDSELKRRQGGYYSEINPIDKKDEILKLLIPYQPEIYTNTDVGYEWLEENGVSIFIKSQSGEELFVDIESEFTLTFSGWHTHYDPYGSDYELLISNLKAILNNGKYAIYATCNGQWMYSSLSDDAIVNQAYIRKMIKIVLVYK